MTPWHSETPLGFTKKVYILSVGGPTQRDVDHEIHDALAGLARLLKEKISGWAAGSQQSENTFVQDSSMKCT
jgi:hypothetical protein